MIVSALSPALCVKRDRNDEIEILSAPGLEECSGQERRQETDEVSFSVKLHFLNDSGKLGRVAAERPCARIRRNMQNTFPA